MGEIAEMMVEGILCETCGTLLDGEAPGHPRRCEDCQAYDASHSKKRRPAPRKQKPGKSRKP